VDTGFLRERHAEGNHQNHNRSSYDHPSTYCLSLQFRPFPATLSYEVFSLVGTPSSGALAARPSCAQPRDMVYLRPWDVFGCLRCLARRTHFPSSPSVEFRRTGARRTMLAGIGELRLRYVNFGLGVQGASGSFSSTKVCAVINRYPSSSAHVPSPPSTGRWAQRAKA
jgi:hypothetical protein